MKLNSNATDRRTRKLLVVAQLMTLAFFALGLAFALYPTPGNLFLFTTLSPVLAPGAAVILATRWIAAYSRRQTSQVGARRVRRAYSGPDPMRVAG
jgi:hypothetical protein